MALTTAPKALTGSTRHRWIAAWRSLTHTPHRRAVHAFRLAAERGDGKELASMLAPDVAVVVDSGDDEYPTVRVVRGVDDAAVLLMHGLTDPADVVITERPVNDQPGLVLERDRERVAVMTIDFIAGLMAVVWIRLQPEKLRHWIHV
jgi:RNA polymerase sigma-70 factor (ECF subfamily)